MSSPFRPCRRACSTNHSPKHHTCRFNVSPPKTDKKPRVLRLRKTQPPTPRAAPKEQDSDLKAYYKQIDWATSALYQAAIHGGAIQGEGDLDMYSQIEADHYASMLKKKKGDEDLCSDKELKRIFKKALSTLGVLMNSLLQGKLFQ